MFEKNIQKSWENYKVDFGIGRMALTLCVFNLFLFSLSLILFGKPIYEVFMPIVLSLLLIFSRGYIAKLNDIQKFAVNALFITFCILIDYYYIGLIDKMAGGFSRYDQFFATLDLFLFDKHMTIYLSDIISHTNKFSWLIYDFLQVSYMTYFLFPFLGGIFYFLQLNERNKYKISRYIGSITIFFTLNYFFYILVPVSGPQYYILEVEQLVLPLSTFGRYLNNIVFTAHPNYIDCFPSGHAGIAILVTLWMFKIKNHYRYIFLIFCIGMVFATLALKYHYFLDVICAIPFSLICFYLSHFLIPTNYDLRHDRKWKY